ncbi:hypothetical protein ACQ4PT_024787 [Festuca glaucescens]
MPMDAADVSDEAMFSAEEDPGEDEEEECRICRLPAEPARPLRHPCACRGSIRFVHDDCQLQWIAARHKRRCEVCHRDISIKLLYAADTPSRLPLYEFLVGLPDKLRDLLLPLLFVVFAVCVVPEFFIHLANRWAWRLALAESFGQVHYLLSIRLSTASLLALFATLVAVEHWTELFDVAPFARWVDHVETQLLDFEGFDGLQVLALYAIEAFLMVVICDLGFACILGFLPFSLGRIILWCISCSDFCNVNEVNSYTSRVSILLTGYGFIISAGIISVVLNTFGQYLRGKRLTIAVFIRRLAGILLAGIVAFISFANFCLKFLNAAMYPMLFGWWLDIWASKIVGATMSERFKLLFASPFASTAPHWLVGHTFSYLHAILFIVIHKILRPGVAIPSHYNFDEPFYKLYFKKRILVSITIVPVVIFTPIQIADQLAPCLFPLDITYFGHPAKGLSFWQAPRNYADSICRVLLLRFLIDKTDILMYVGCLVKKVVIIPFLIGSLADLLLIPLLAGPNDDVSVFYIWYMGYVLLRIWMKLVHDTRTTPFLAYFIDERWGPKIVRYRADYRSGAISLCWFFQDIFMPIATKLVAALCVPYVLAKGIFPRFGYSAAVNSAVYRFAWLVILGLGAFCYLAKVFCVELHASIRDDRYLIRKRVQDVADGSSDINS